MLDADQIANLLDLRPLDVEGGLFRRTWASHETIGATRPVGTAIYALFTEDVDSFSAIHRLDADEVWHHYVGDALVVELFSDQGHTTVVLGPDLAAGERPQLVIAAGCWMGAHVRDGGRFALIGCTMAPGFTGDGYVGGERSALVAQFPDPQSVRAIERLTRPGRELGRPPDV